MEVLSSENIPVHSRPGTWVSARGPCDRNESQMRIVAHDVTEHVFDAGHDLAEEVPDEMAEVVLPFLAEHL